MRPFSSSFVLSASDFNPRTRVGCDLGFSTCDHPLNVISIHAPAWGATRIATALNVTLRISIHAPAWGATSYNPDLYVIFAISIHAPAWGATLLEFSRRSNHWNFNPRTRVGCDQDCTEGLRKICCISIHAPAWGATLLVMILYRTEPISIHAPAWGATSYNPDLYVIFAISIHAPAWGATLLEFSRRSNHWNFNPRTRVGCDQDCTEGLRKICCISIHAPAWGATLLVMILYRTEPISIHAPAWGATSYNPDLYVIFAISIHAPAWGATLLEFSRRSNHWNFNPRTRVGCDPGLSLGGYPRLISIHAPAWGATLIWHLLYALCKFQSTHPRGVRRHLDKV